MTTGLRSLGFAAGLALATSTAPAQTAFQVKDIRPGTTDSYISTSTAGGVGYIFFSIHELWRTDGTTAGTTLVRSFPERLRHGGIEFGGLLYFGDDGVASPPGLWRSDGTTSGTTLVAYTPSEESRFDIHRSAAVVGNRLYFVTRSRQVPDGHGLWVTDGTAAGTRKLKDFPPVPGVYSLPIDLTAAGSRLFFTAPSAASGHELWTSDGTAAGTVQVADLNPGSAGTYFGSLVALAGELLFAASADGAAPRLWRSDGTAAGTAPVGSVQNASGLARFGNAVFFAGEEPGQGVELWRTDGTAAGTTLVADIDAGAGSSHPASLVDAAGTLFFAGGQGGTGRELWKTDGTAAGTVLVKDLRPGPLDGGIYEMTAVGGSVFFAATDGGGHELWKSDGTAAGTVLITDVNPGSSADPRDLVAVHGGVVFKATDGTHGYELWHSGGVRNDATLLRDFDTRPGDSGVDDPLDVGGRLFFRADDGAHGREVWVSDGSTGGTRLVRDVNAGAGSSLSPYYVGMEPLAGNLQRLSALGSTAFFEADDGIHGGELWKSDGTEAGTVLVKDINPGALSSGLEWLASLGPVMLFTAREPSAGWELWRSDGTTAGTFLVRDILPGPADSYPRFLTPVGGRLFMAADDGVHGLELWVSDGTSSGTRLVADIQPGPAGSGPGPIRAAGEVAYFFANDGVHDHELWRSDGTPAGTFMVTDLAPVNHGSHSEILGAGQRLYFGTSDGFWTSDGTAAGTVFLHYAWPHNDLIAAPLGSDMLFRSGPGEPGSLELWRSDGTAAGTRLVKDLSPGFGYGRPYALTPAGGGVVFCAQSADPFPTWWSDGTEEGTFVVDTNGCTRGAFAPSGPFVYFSGGYGSPGGDELWALPLSAITTVRVSDCSIAEGQSGPRTCPFTVSLSSALTTPVTLSYATADGTAVAGTDYVAASGTLTFAPGATAQTIPITINGDATPEVSEGFSLTLSNVSGAVLVDGDAAGTILDDEASRFHALPPCRLVDTRGPAGPAGGPPLGAGGTRSFAVTGSCGVPASAKAVAVNLTVVNPGDAGNLRAYPAGSPAPPTSVVNFAAGRTRANNAVLTVGPGGAVTVQCDMAPGSIAKAHLVVDVAGYFE